MRFLTISFLMFGLCGLPDVSLAQSEPIEGAWSGTGYLQPKDGKRERVRCRLKFHKETEKVYRISANCATTDATVSQTGSILKVGDNVYVGEFHNPEYDVSGRIRISVTGSTQNITMTSGKGSGNLTLSRR